MPYYGFRLNDQRDWVRMKEFNSIEEYKAYVEKKNIPYSKLIDEITYQKYYVNKSSTEPDEDETE